ncbi:MAG: putative 26S proteasome regulatory subunit [Stictis urceolatum]|nr:putative 26S proteasome regulatory subunit [Stictis urceolata]
MSKIEAGLHDHYAITKEEAAAPSSGTAQRAGARSTGRPGASGPETNLPDTAFAKVNSVVTGSPADDAGMKAGDEVLRFGLVDFMNHEKLSKVAETVQQNQGVREQNRNIPSSLQADPKARFHLPTLIDYL